MSVNIDLTVYKITDTEFEPLGVIENYTSLIWPDNFNSYSEFELNAPITDKNSDLIKSGYYLYKGGDTLMKIQIIQEDLDSDGNRVYKIKGRSLEQLLEKRIAWDSWGVIYNKTDLPSTIMIDLVNKNCVNPTLSQRKIPRLSCADDPKLGSNITFQAEGSVYDCENKIATDQDIGFRIKVDIKLKTFTFEVYAGVNRTRNQTDIDIVEFDTDLEDIITSSYYKNEEDKANVGWVKGTEESGFSFNTVVGDNTLVGLSREESYIDGSGVSTEGLDNATYTAALKQYGEGILSDTTETETFEAKVRTFNNLQHIFNKDYFLGDKVTITDRVLGVTIDVRISAIEEDYSDTYELVITFGYGVPTLFQKIKRKIK